MSYNYRKPMPTRPIFPMMRSASPTCNKREVLPGGSTTGGPDFDIEPGPPVKQDLQYIQGWLSRILGKYVKVEFLIGTSMLIDREGILTEVGVNYIVLKESGTKDDVLCDMYSIKFVRVFDDQEKAVICK